jgi:hypothetical protein
LKLRAFVALSAIALAGCGDSTEPDASTLSFSYTGAGAANATTFSVTGEIPANIVGTPSIGATAWAAGGVDPSSNYSTILGAIPKTSTTWDLFGIGVTRKSVGTSPVDANCDDESTNCTGIFMFFSLNPNGDDFQYFCALTSGTVSITTFADSRIAGTFSGSGFCENSAFVETPFTITNGQFNVAISSQFTFN